MPLDAATEAYRIAVALGIGLLIGLERERRKAERGGGAEGIRTFALVALIGAITQVLGGDAALVAGAGMVGSIVIAAYVTGSRKEPGVTTEVAVVATYFLGALALHEPNLAATGGVATAVLLAFRKVIHDFVRSTLSEAELRDGLIFASAAFVILPLLPNTTLDPYGTVNPAAIWRIVVIFMAISGAGYIAVRFFGPRAGLPVAGFFAGFVSSAATVASMAGIARRVPAQLSGAAAGAVLATVASLAFLIALVAATSLDAVTALALPIGAATVGAVGYSAILAFRTFRVSSQEGVPPGRAFDLRSAIGFAVAVTVIEFVSAALTDRFGASALVVTAAVAGFADTHAVAIGAASLVHAGTVAPGDAAFAIVAALTTNQVTKVGLALSLGRGRYAVLVIAGFALIMAAAWAGVAAGALR